MLKTLSVRHVVLIDKLDLDFSGGLVVLSGETGAGKSVLLDSLGLLLGNRADTGLIRAGAEKLSVCGVFELKDKNNPFFELCAENEIELDQEIIIKRTLDRSGKGKILINDQPVSQRFLKDVAPFLVEIHGQFDNQGLLNPATHLSVLDAFGGYKQALLETSQAFFLYQNLKNELCNAQNALASALADEENLRHWADELEKANVLENEEETLNRKHADFMHAEKLIENLNTAYQSLQGRDIASFIQRAQGALARVNQLTENRYADVSEALDTALVQLDEATARIEKASAEISLSASEADFVEERLFALKALARKHQTEINNLPMVLSEIKKKLAALDKGGENIADLERATKSAFENYQKAAKNLSALRQNAAQTLSSAVMRELPPLKMERAVFKVEMSELPTSMWGEKGIDSVCFTVSTNPNTPQGPLQKIASGGELARFMLALKVNLAQKSSVETLVFDEVDSGIGGATAQAVGERLARLSNSVQVFVVTHAPQVAAFSHEHFKVSKALINGQNVTSVTLLNAEQKKEEIARMLSGQTISDEARAAADILIAGAN